MFLKDLDQAAKIQPAETPVESVTNETQYLVYKLIVDEFESKIGVPLDMVTEFDNYISENEVTAILENLTRFNAIHIV